ncbi:MULTISPECIES: exodeoxyribonuclease VII small subunit [Cobetia]|uniref:Exodeoxyribonuclease 7 small subunit n=1 Tax=Cobetia crustatorum TaxID=553385 RepID=A0A558HSC6_9GAMM|nr:MULTISPECIES: exodeoxyribonuclease VII small subunit [Cobetia]TVU71994.1 exodeoxyribonuclease VII small subunit [Cobetia crustatorum]
MAEQEAPQDFAATLARLEGLVTRLEAGDMSLEASLGAFEEGVRLAREAQQRLDSAELRLQALIEGPDGELVPAAFAAPATSASVAGDTDEEKDW